jgi:uncharacterized protein YjiK
MLTGQFIRKASISFILLLCLPALNRCANSGGTDGKKNANAIGYVLTKPDKTIILPMYLREISGVSIIDSSTVACIQDENGVVFILDITKDKIINRVNFGADGDYEAICRVDKTFYVLRSDGVLFKIAEYATSSVSKKIELTHIKADNNEGLCFDKNNNRLLIAPKEKNDKGPEFKENLVIYGFDQAADSIIKKPVIKIDLSKTAKFLDQNKIINLKKDKKKEKKNFTDFIFKPSEIGIHPITNKLYILCAVEKLLLVFDMDGNIENAEKLDHQIFNAPEGIAFFSNGDMLISNESGNTFPSIMRFNYRKK